MTLGMLEFALGLFIRGTASDFDVCSSTLNFYNILVGAVNGKYSS